MIVYVCVCVCVYVYLQNATVVYRGMRNLPKFTILNEKATLLNNTQYSVIQVRLQQVTPTCRERGSVCNWTGKRRKIYKAYRCF